MSTARELSVLVGVVGLLASTACSATAASYVVQPDGNGDYPTIQAAVDAADDFDTIVLTDGVFTGDGNRDIVVPSKRIFINSQSGDYTACQIDCEGTARAEHRGFHFTTAVGTGNPNVQGFGIINGYVTDGGAGIWVEGADPQIINCAVGFCTVDNPYGKGGGIRVSDGGAPQVSLCVFTMNTAGKGGGVAVDNANGTFNYCEISDNTATDSGGGLYVDSAGSAQFGWCDIVSNDAPYGGGVRMLGSYPYLANCNISRNQATGTYAGGVYLQDGSLFHCTLVENSSVEGGGGVHSGPGVGQLVEYSVIAFSQSGYGVGATSGYLPTVSCCDVYGNAAGEYDSVVGDQTGIDGNFSLDPLLCDMEQEDYRVSDESPCLPGNHSCGLSLIGAYDEVCQTPVEAASWGMVKGMYR